MELIWPYLEGKTHVIWDWNGTLVNDVDLMVEIISQMTEAHGLGKLDRSDYRNHFRFPIKDYYQSLGFDFSQVSFEKLSEDFIQACQQRFSHLQLHLGMKDFLQQLSQANMTQIVLSAAQKHMLEEQLSHFGIRNHFAHVYGLDDTHAASKLALGQQMMKETGIPTETAILIGDTDHDLEVGQALGIDVLLLADGHQSHERLQAKHPHILPCRYGGRPPSAPSLVTPESQG